MYDLQYTTLSIIFHITISYTCTVFYYASITIIIFALVRFRYFKFAKTFLEYLIYKTHFLYSLTTFSQNDHGHMDSTSVWRGIEDECNMRGYSLLSNIKGQNRYMPVKTKNTDLPPRHPHG